MDEAHQREKLRELDEEIKEREGEIDTLIDKVEATLAEIDDALDCRQKLKDARQSYETTFKGTGGGQ